MNFSLIATGIRPWGRAPRAFGRPRGVTLRRLSVGSAARRLQ
ncbi:conserved hypothetical protein [Burkholderia pseudomallei MSHR346]|nr:hypothetical protein BMASAVP1_1098 [Burkholderia mallei SAVP1]EEC32886.1 conserved hypothetical protein [Burkholderia pseudomallei 576]EEP51215.1 conserved hypothetical protein [Burkholderia pseudomallei MSHR346]EEP84562.1 conserved hypothetical protein [Burkholderia mallei GB8 horse 4]